MSLQLYQAEGVVICDNVRLRWQLAATTVLGFSQPESTVVEARVAVADAPAWKLVDSCAHV